MGKVIGLIVKTEAETVEAAETVDAVETEEQEEKPAPKPVKKPTVKK